MTQAWHGGCFHVMCSLSFCFPRLGMLVGMGIALEKSGYPLQPCAAGAQCEQVEAFLVMVVGSPGWAKCCSPVAHSSGLCFMLQERVEREQCCWSFCRHHMGISALFWSLWAELLGLWALPDLSSHHYPQVEGSASVQHLGWQSVL